MQRRNFLLGAAAFAVLRLPAGAATANPTLTVNSAINKAGRQRMLSQRCAKAWMMRRMGVLSDRAAALLGESTGLFEAQLGELKTLQPNDEIGAALAALDGTWRDYRSALNAQDPVAVHQWSDTVLAGAHRVTLAYEKLAASPVGRLVNVAGRQRMLSQRMAKLYYFASIDVRRDESLRELDKARKEFIAAQVELGAAVQNTPEIRSELELATMQWTFFELATQVRDTRDLKRAAADVATTSERILQQMEVVVGLYEKVTA